MKPIRHGTNAGYARHLYAGTPPCDACREAKNKYQREYRQRTGRTKYVLVPIQQEEGDQDD